MKRDDNITELVRVHQDVDFRYLLEIEIPRLRLAKAFMNESLMIEDKGRHFISKWERAFKAEELNIQTKEVAIKADKRSQKAFWIAIVSIGITLLKFLYDIGVFDFLISLVGQII